MFKLAALRQEDDYFRQLADSLRLLADYDLRFLKRVCDYRTYTYIVRHEDAFCMTTMLDDLYAEDATGQLVTPVSLSNLPPLYFNGGNKPNVLWSKI